MRTTEITNPSFFLDGKPLVDSSKFTTWQTFEEICNIYTSHLHESGRAILSIRMDGVEIDCAVPPTETSLRSVKKIEVESCLFEELVVMTLGQISKTALAVSDDVLELSTDCLILTPVETFEKWKTVLEEIKSQVGYVPKFFAMHPFSNPVPEETTEEHLTAHIQEIQHLVDFCRKAWDIQDVVNFSDTLELKIVGWLKKQAAIADKLKANITIQ